MGLLKAVPVPSEEESRANVEEPKQTRSVAAAGGVGSSLTSRRVLDQAVARIQATGL